MARTFDEWLQYQQTVHPAGMALGLDRLRVVGQRLELRQPAATVMTVAGTNGKGSTVAFASAIARAAGWRVGTYTSPHLLRYTERIRIDGREADPDRLVDAFERIESARGELPLTYFEFGTLAAFLLFAEAGLDLAVLEVGLGGRLDAVNLVDADVAVLTSVGLDHVDVLGPDREAIGAEKAGVFRRGRPAVIAEPVPPTSVLAAAERTGAIALRCGIDYRYRPTAGGGWRFEDGRGGFELPPPALAASCQLGNAAAALAALRALPDAAAISPAAAAEGVASARLAGRLQRIAGPVEVVLDVAHNPDAARVLAEWLARHRPRGVTQAVFSALGDKDIPGIVGALLPVIDAWRLTGLREAGPRGLDVEEVWRRCAGLLSRTLATRHVDVAAALTEALSQAAPGDRVVVFGSFHTVGAAMALLGVTAEG